MGTSSIDYWEGGGGVWVPVVWGVSMVYGEWVLGYTVML